MSIYTDDCIKKLMFFDGTTEISKYVVPDSLKKQDYLCTGQLNFGEVNSAKIQFKTFENLNLTGKMISVKFGTDTENVLIGTYKVTYSSTKSNSSIVTITAYDSIKDFDRDVSDWYVSLSWPIKLKSLRKSLCEHVGIETADIKLVNDEIMIQKTVNPSTLNGMEMLFYIGQLNGVFAHAADTYSMEWVSLGKSAVQIAKSVTYGPAAYEAKSYSTAAIGGLVIRQEDGDAGVSIGSTNKYVVQGNILVYGYSTDELSLVASRLYDKIKDVQYVPCSIKVKYLPEIKLGSMCSYDGNIFYVLQRTTSGLLFDTLTAGGNEYLESDTGIESQLIQLRGKANILSRTIEETKNTITDVEKGLKNEITATASDFDVKLRNLQSEIDGQIEVINGRGLPTLDNYPAYNWTSGPKIGDKLAEGLRFTYTDAVYRKHQRTLFFDEATATTYSFIKKDDIWIWEPLGNTEYSVLQKQITDLNVTAQGITESMEELSVKISNEYITQVAAKTLVSRTANGIKEEISKVYTTKDDVSSFRNSIEKTAAGLTAQISEINEALDGANEVYTIRGQPVLNSYPAYNWTSGPKTGDKLAAGLRFTYTDESYRKHNRALVFDEAAGKTYRFVKNGDTWGFNDVGDTEFSWVNKKLAEYKVTVDGISADLSKFETKVGADYITKVDAQASINYSVEGLSREFSKTYATQKALNDYSTTTQMNLAISENAEGIKTEISKSYAEKSALNNYSTTTQMNLAISENAEGIKTEISKSYAEKSALNNYSTTTQMNLAISESAEGIKTTVASSTSKWNYSRYWHQIDYSGYGTPWDAGYENINQYRGRTYLDVVTGYVYYCCADDGSYEDWFKDYECITMLAELKSLAEQTDKKFSWLIKSGDSESNMVLTDRLYELVTERIDLTGLVTISSLKESGQTVINADNITTGSIKGRRLEACTMDGGAIAIGANNIVMNEAGLWVIGECSADKPAYQVNNRGEIMQYWADGIRRFYSNGLGVSGTWVTHFDEYTASSDWYKICIAANNTSDARYKNTIKSLDDEEHMEELFNSLKPSAFYYNKGTEYVETQRHLGFIAQDIEKAITEAGIEADMALFDHINEDKLGVNKQELIALCVWQIQKLKARVNELEKEGGVA